MSRFKCVLSEKKYFDLNPWDQTHFEIQNFLDFRIYMVFHNYWNKAGASQIFSIYFILFLFSDYCWEIVNILVNSTKYSKVMPWMKKTYYKTKFFKIVHKQDTERNSILTHFQTGVRFSSWSSTLKLMVLVKIVDGWVSHHLGVQLHRRNVHALSTTL